MTNSINSAHAIELALIEKIDARLDSMAEDVRDVRERVIRIEAQDVSGKIASLETRVHTLERWQSRVTGQIALVIVPIAALVGGFVKVIFDVLAR